MSARPSAGSERGARPRLRGSPDQRSHLVVEQVGRPRPGRTILLHAFLPEEPAPGRTEAELVDRARRGVEATAAVHGSPELVRVSSWPKTMSRYTVGHLERVTRAEQALAPWPAVRIAGATYHGVGLSDCISGAHAAADAIAERLDAPLMVPT